MLQALKLYDLAFDLFALFYDGWSPAEVGVGWRYVVEAPVVAPVVVMRDEGADLSLEVAGQKVVLQQDLVFEGLAPALDLALGLGTRWSATDMVLVWNASAALITTQGGLVIRS